MLVVYTLYQQPHVHSAAFGVGEYAAGKGRKLAGTRWTLSKSGNIIIYGV